jgi:hypothetical protein
MAVLVGCAALIVTVKLLVAPTFIERVAGCSAVMATAGATTLMIAEAEVPFRAAVTPACPNASVETGTSAVVCPAGTVTCAGAEIIPLGGDSVSGTMVSVPCTAEIVSVSEALPPRVTLDTAGTSDTTVGSAGVTVIWLVALVPFKLALTCVAPGRIALTEIGALTLPAGTITDAGTEAMLASLEATAKEVSVVCAAEILAMSEPLDPCVSARVLGARLVTVGGAGVTLTVALALPPFAEAVTIVLPTPWVVTGITTLVWPEAKPTLAGTVATLVLVLETLRVPAAVGAGDSAAVSVPVAPAVTERGLGASDTGFGRFGVPNTVMVMAVPDLPAI